MDCDIKENEYKPKKRYWKMRCKQHKQVVLYENPMRPGEGYCYLCKKHYKTNIKKHGKTKR
jgi:hypothetical protein